MKALLKTMLVGFAVLLTSGCEAVLAPQTRVERTVSPELCQPHRVPPGARVASYTRSFVDRLSLEPEGEIHISINYGGLYYDKLRFTYSGGGHHLHPQGSGRAEAGQIVWGHNIGFPFAIRIIEIDQEELTYLLEPGQGCPETSA